MKVPTPIQDYTTDELQEAIGPIASLISKSEKAQQKLEPGTWQYSMLQNYLKALRIAWALMKKEADQTGNFTSDDLREALGAIASMIGKTEKVRAKFSSGTSHRTLQQNRLKALRIAEAMITLDLDKRDVS